MVVMEIEESFDYTQEIVVYNDGEKATYGCGDKEFGEIMASWKELISNGHQMPAFGVSLNSATVMAMKTGVWVEFVFDGVRKCNEMPFEKLLINVNPAFQGFNIIRYNSGFGYDGRCFYVDLVGNDMSSFYNVLMAI